MCCSHHPLSFHRSLLLPPSLMTIIELVKSSQLMYFHSHSNAFEPIKQKILPLMIPPSLERGRSSSFPLLDTSIFFTVT